MSEKRKRTKRLAPGEWIESDLPIVWKNDRPTSRKLLIGVPTLGVIRMEWHSAIQNLVVPCNWSCAWCVPYGYLVADGQNAIAHQAMATGMDWLLLIEDDTAPPPNLITTLEGHIREKTGPIISAVYHLKNSASREPLMYRGRGSGAYRPGPKTWKYGDQVWVDGVPTGCLLVDVKVLKALAEHKPWYDIRNMGGTTKVRKIFETPAQYHADPATGNFEKLLGTSDLYFCDEVIKYKVLKDAGWPKHAAMKYPFLVDTSIVCQHLDRSTGRAW